MSDLAEERLSAEGRLVLEDLLRSEPEARDHYIRFMALCSDLHEFAATALSAGQERLKARQRTVAFPLRERDAASLVRPEP